MKKYFGSDFGTDFRCWIGTDSLENHGFKQLILEPNVLEQILEETEILPEIRELKTTTNFETQIWDP